MGKTADDGFLTPVTSSGGKDDGWGGEGAGGDFGFFDGDLSPAVAEEEGTEARRRRRRVTRSGGGGRNRVMVDTWGRLKGVVVS